jgi:NUMOD4 motif/HNH endonuclease
MRCKTERWLPIPGYEGSYEVSTAGRIKSLERYVPHAYTGKQLVREKILIAPPDTKGYPRATLAIDTSKKSWAVHRAVMAAFVPRADWQLMHVNHIDGNTKNNALENLEWCTASENRLHSYRVLKRKHPSTGKFGVLHHLSKPVTGVCIASGDRRDYETGHDVLRDGFSHRCVNSCINGKQKSHQGWLWYRPSDVPLNPSYQPGTTSGAKNGTAKAVICIRPDGTSKRYQFAQQAKSDGFNPIGISAVLHGRQEVHRGCKWQFDCATAGGRIWGLA